MNACVTKCQTIDYKKNQLNQNVGSFLFIYKMINF